MPNAPPLSVLTILLRLAIAFAVALPLAWERQTGGRLGLRTVPLVSVGACGYLLLSLALGESPEGNARLLQGILTGIGFIGGGAIVKRGTDVVGIATAATIWNMGAVGSAAAYGQYALAVLLAATNIVILEVGGLMHAFDAARSKKNEKP